MSPMLLATVVRLVTWLLPPRSRDWAEAMLNEAAYIPSYRGALRWMLGSMLCAIRERTSYEMEEIFMHRRILKTIVGLGAVSVIALMGVYAIQKPYQRERIKLTILHRVEASTAGHAGTER